MSAAVEGAATSARLLGEPLSASSIEREHLPGTTLDSLSGSKVVLRPFTWEDVARRAAWPAYVPPEFLELNVDLSTEVRRREWFRQRTRQRGPFWFAVENLQGELVGEVTLRDIDREAGSARLGIHLSAAHVDRGYGTDAVRVTMRYLFDCLHFSEIRLDVAAWNRRAIHCYEKCGFEVRYPFWRYHGQVHQMLKDERFTHIRPYVRLDGGIEMMKYWEMTVSVERYRQLGCKDSSRSGGSAGQTEERDA